MLVEIFCEFHDFCKQIENNEEKRLPDTKKTSNAGRKNQLSLSEIMTITAYFHFSNFKDLKSYYNTMIRGYL